uniref:NUC153 domain-containing protein n=1 Tax=Panagrolaimus sp. JU765 TaxID=591449 RepID=A0AC34RS41_9BILA
MEVSVTDDVKIYDLSTGDSIPEWISAKRRRKLQKQHNDYRNTIRLIQEFGFKDYSTALAITPDCSQILATGMYKPMLKCYNLDEMTVKFEHGLDIITMKILPLSDDFRKVILMQDMRYIEIFSNGCRYFQFRVPALNRDMAFSKEASDLFVVGDSSEVYRFNFEIGRFATSLQSEATALNCCAVSDYHQLLLCGTNDGRVEAFDHRDPAKVGILDCALSTLDFDIETKLGGTAEITSIAYKDALTYGVGTSTGHVLLYDLRSSRPMLIKDHNVGLPITKIDFAKEQDAVLSMDSRMLKFWDENTGKPIGAIEPAYPLVDFIRYPDSGLLFFAVESPEMLQYFVPMFGPAPRWCYHLDAIVEELEEVKTVDTYDDYKFVTKENLQEIGLDNLIGTSLLRAHMHGYFIDARLYNRAVTFIQPQAVKNLRRRRIRDKMEKASTALPEPKQLAARIKVNKELATELKIMAQDKNKSQIAKQILADDRYASLFTEEDFAIDKHSDQFKRMQFNAQRREAARKKKKAVASHEEDEGPKSGLFMDDEPVDDMASDLEDLFQGDKEESSEESSEEESVDEDEEKPVEPDIGDVSDEDVGADAEPVTEIRKPKAFKFVAVENRRQMETLLAGEKATGEDADETLNQRKRKMAREILDMDDTPFGTKSITVVMKSEKAADEKKQKKHLEERQASQRSAGNILRQLKPLPKYIRGPPKKEKK